MWLCTLQKGLRLGLLLVWGFLFQKLLLAVFSYRVLELVYPEEKEAFPLFPSCISMQILKGICKPIRRKYSVIALKQCDYFNIKHDVRICEIIHDMKLRINRAA